VAAERRRRVSLPGLAACVVLFLVVVARYNPGGNQPRYQLEFFLVTALLYLLAPTSAWVLGDSMGTRRAYSAALEERAVRAERERDAQAQVAAAAERARIARELHDVIAHNLSVLVAQADGGRYAFDTEPGRSRQALAEIGDTGRQALSEMSHLLGVLRTGEEVPALAPTPGISEIAHLVTQAREVGMRVSHRVDGTVRSVPGGVALAAYRMVQEALTNVRKHAGPGAAAEVTLQYHRDELLVRITDDGRGTAGQQTRLPRYAAARPGRTAVPGGDAGHGLAGMRERVATHGGTVQAGTRPGGGFEVSARLPLPPAVPAAPAAPAVRPRLAAVPASPPLDGA
jgi:signal transduction histidine kinase